MVGPLAHLLKNRFYIGEVVYRGEIHKGEHAPILERELFDAVQARLAERAVRRKMRRARSPALLTGWIFDDRNNPISPSHANKQGVRYRYYVSQALLQNHKSESVRCRARPDRISKKSSSTHYAKRSPIDTLRPTIMDGDRSRGSERKDKTTEKKTCDHRASSPGCD